MLDRISPNAITISRILLIPVFVPLLLARGTYEYSTEVAVAIFALLSATDGLDGYIARSRNKVSKLGIFLDPLADKLLVTAALVTLVQLEEVAAWVVVLIISREFAVTGLRLIAASEGQVIAAGKLGKLKTTSQIAMVLVLIATGSPTWLEVSIIWIAVIMTLASGIEYFWNGRDLLRQDDSPSADAG